MVVLVVVARDADVAARTWDGVGTRVGGAAGRARGRRRDGFGSARRDARDVDRARRGGGAWVNAWCAGDGVRCD